MVDYSFFSFWVESLWGSNLLALFGTGTLFAFIGILGRMSYILLFVLIALYFLVFGIGFFGVIVWLPSFIGGIGYCIFQIYKFLQGSE